MPDGRFAPAQELVAYFVCSEALANVAKYAGASQARVTVVASEHELRVRVGDDGVGGADARRGSGLRGLADRVEALGGRLRVESPRGGGTRVEAILPIDWRGRLLIWDDRAVVYRVAAWTVALAAAAVTVAIVRNDPATRSPGTRLSP